MPEADSPVSVQAPKPGPTRQSRLREYLRSMILVLVVMFPFRSSIFDWNDVPTGSMKPTILEGDRITVNKLEYGLRIPFTLTWLATWSAPERGEIVTFASPTSDTRLVKRVVGLPGERVRLHNNIVWINDQRVSQELITDVAMEKLPAGPMIPVIINREDLGSHPHSITLAPKLVSFSDYQEITVPENCYFMLGDNRDMSNDSRFIGCIPRASIYGRCLTVALSLDPSRSYRPRWERWLTALR